MSPFDEFYIDTLKNRYADFSGRARRSEYWYFALFNTLIMMILYAIVIIGITTDMASFITIGGIMVFIYALGVIIPSLAVAIRRLHDTGNSGWLYLVGIIPLVGPIILLVLFCTDGKPGENKWGLNPKEVEDEILESV
jgi:uncharacterized membrane protein YhaH (DUF805 family)